MTVPKSPLFAFVQPQVRQLIAHYEQQTVVDLTHPAPLSQIDWAGVFGKFVATVSDLVRTLAGNPADKRQAVIDAAVVFYEQAILPQVQAALGTNAVVTWAFNTFIAPTLENLVVSIAGGLYDTLDAVVTKLVGAVAPTVPSIGTPLPGGQAPVMPVPY